MRTQLIKTALTAFVLAMVSCKQETADHVVRSTPPADDGTLLRVGSATVTQADLDYQLKERHAGRTDDVSRRKALDELTERARLTQAAHDAGLDDDPVARAEIARILITRLKEKQLSPHLKEAAAGSISEARLREIYESRKGSFQSAEKRQVAVLWLNPGADPERSRMYQEKMTQAREWYFSNADLAAHPDQGFSVLGVDYSEHAASRYKNGVAGWLEAAGGMDGWSKAVADIAFSLKTPGEVSEVISRPEGIFLVRYMALKPASLRPFEAVSAELEHTERQRLRHTAEAEFDAIIQAKYPVAPLLQ